LATFASQPARREALPARKPAYLPHDAAVAGRIRQLAGGDGDSIARRTQHFAQRLAPHQGYVAIEHQNGGAARNSRQRLQQRVAGTKLFRLLHPFDRRAHEGGHHFRAAVTVDDEYALRPQRQRGIEHMRKQRPAGNPVQHLRQRGTHALALTGGENNDVEWHQGSGPGF